ncbi:DUF6907 domain-containing protein [Streptomyces sp. SYSU K21746]
MTGPRTVTVHTLDHGNVTLSEPSWCLGHEAQHPEYQVDLIHTGPAYTLDFRGVQLVAAMFVQSPHADAPEAQQTGVYVEFTSYGKRLDPAGLDQLAAALVEEAAELRALARQLSVMLAGGGQ